MQFDVIVEIPKGQRNKYEMGHQTGRIRLDRMHAAGAADAAGAPAAAGAANALGAADAARAVEEKR